MNFKAKVLLVFWFFVSVSSASLAATSDDESVAEEETGNCAVLDLVVCPEAGDGQVGQIAALGGAQPVAWYYNPCWQRTMAVSAIGCIAVATIAGLAIYIGREGDELGDKADEVGKMCGNAVAVAGQFAKALPQAIAGLSDICKGASSQVELLSHTLNQSFGLVSQAVVNMTEACENSGSQAVVISAKLDEAMARCTQALIVCSSK